MEVLDLDQVLKERQEELHQRAKLVGSRCFWSPPLRPAVSSSSGSPPSGSPQLGQLDVAVRDHKQEMAKKAESLQQSLESKEKELRDAQRNLTDRNLKVRRNVCDRRTGLVVRDADPPLSEPGDHL